MELTPATPGGPRPGLINAQNHPAPADRSNSLVIVDSFTPSFTDPDQTPHGTMVRDSARHSGFPGAITEVQTGDSEALQQQRFALISLQSIPLDGPKARQSLDDYVQNHTLALLGQAQGELDTQSQGGTHQAVTNFSLGAGPAVATSELYYDARLAWSPPPGPDAGPAAQREYQNATQLNQNLAAALEVPPADLSHSDPNISGPARAQFQQKLVDYVSNSLGSPDLQPARQSYAQSVVNYEALGNSVVHAAGNEGGLLALMAQDNGGQTIQAPPNFFQTSLATAQTTNVGAWEVNAEGKPGLANFSSGADQVPILGFGWAPQGQPGTSFAAPRVAGMMQFLHHQNPTMTSAEVERLMLRIESNEAMGRSEALMTM